MMSFFCGTMISTFTQRVSWRAGSFPDSCVFLKAILTDVFRLNPGEECFLITRAIRDALHVPLHFKSDSARAFASNRRQCIFSIKMEIFPCRGKEVFFGREKVLRECARSSVSENIVYTHTYMHTLMDAYLIFYFTKSTTQRLRSRRKSVSELEEKRPSRDTIYNIRFKKMDYKRFHFDKNLLTRAYII